LESNWQSTRVAWSGLAAFDPRACPLDGQKLKLYPFYQALLTKHPIGACSDRLGQQLAGLRDADQLAPATSGSYPMAAKHDRHLRFPAIGYSKPNRRIALPQCAILDKPR
jgi:hypothetical protein